MRTELTADEISSYRTNGFLIVPDLLERDELELWRETVDRAVQERPTPFSVDLAAPEDQVPDPYYAKVFTQRVNLFQTDEGIREIILDERIGKLAADLAGLDGIRIWHDQALIKQPYGNPTGFHLDVPYWSFTSPHALSIWVALDDATIENGCLYYVPGSHLAEKYDNVEIGPELGALFEVYPEWKDVAPVACPVPAGGCLFHNGLTFHGAGANMTPRARRAMTAGFMPDGATFNGIHNVLPPSYMATLQVGDVLDDERYNPLIYSRSSAMTNAVTTR